jgi:pimeloyl-ACP methyl ester carboxylesterase
VELGGKRTAWTTLEAAREPGSVELRWRVDGGGGGLAAEVPVCAGRGVVALDGASAPAADPGPVVVPLSAGEHLLSVRVTVSGYERRVACGAPLRVGRAEAGRAGLLRFRFPSPHAAAGGGRAVVYLPEGYDAAKPAPLLVLVHPWNGSIWTYAAYQELLSEAEKRGVVLLMPSGLGNSLYAAPAEDEVMRAIGAAMAALAIDPARVSIAGASMGGAGATTIGLHHPDRFASVTSFFGDSRYDLATYVKAILPTEADAHRVNAADVADNARNLPVWLIHGEDDHVSPVVQSEILARALGDRGFTVRFDRAPAMGHAGALVAMYARDVVDRASDARAPDRPRRVSYRSVRREDTGAYGVTLTPAHGGDAYVDVEGLADGSVRVHAADNVRAIALGPGALGVKSGAAVSFDAGVNAVEVSW